MADESRQRPDRLTVLCKREVPLGLGRSLRNFAREGMKVYGPIEVKRFRTYPHHYAVDVVLHLCVEDEMGAHNVRYSDLKFQRRTG